MIIWQLSGLSWQLGKNMLVPNPIWALCKLTVKGFRHYLRAYMWWSISAHNGDNLAAEYSESIANKMMPAHISKAQEMVNRCFGQ
jgi:hypothetical protein